MRGRVHILSYSPLHLWMVFFLINEQGIDIFIYSIYSMFHTLNEGQPSVAVVFSLNFLPLENKTTLLFFRSSQMVESRTSKRFLATDMDNLVLRWDVHRDVRMCSMVIRSRIQKNPVFWGEIYDLQKFLPFGSMKMNMYYMEIAGQHNQNIYSIYNIYIYTYGCFQK